MNYLHEIIPTDRCFHIGNKGLRLTQPTALTSCLRGLLTVIILHSFSAAIGVVPLLEMRGVEESRPVVSLFLFFFFFYTFRIKRQIYLHSHFSACLCSTVMHYNSLLSACWMVGELLCLCECTEERSEKETKNEMEAPTSATLVRHEIKHRHGPLRAGCWSLSSS